MKRVDFLIKDIRSLSNVGEARFSDDLLAIYLNEAQSTIRDIIYLANNEANILKDVFYIDVINGQREYDLPERMYAENSILTVKARSEWSDRDEYRPIRFLSMKDYQREYGYTLLNKKLLLSVRPEQTDVDRLQIFYNSPLPDLQKRAGLVQSVTPTTISLDPSIDFNDEFLSSADFISSVNGSGDISKSDIQVVSQAGPVITVDDTTGVVAGNYIASGAYSTTNSRLPIECEDFLKKYCERRIAAADSSSVDLNTTDLFSEEEKQRIRQIFEKSMDDTLYPVISPETPWL